MDLFVRRAAAICIASIMLGLPELLLIPVAAQCDPSNFNTSTCRNIHYNAAEDTIYATCRTNNYEDWYTYSHSLATAIYYNNQTLACGYYLEDYHVPAYSIEDACQYRVATLRGTVFTTRCDGVLLSIDLSRCLAIDDENRFMYDCYDYDDYYAPPASCPRC